MVQILQIYPHFYIIGVRRSDGAHRRVWEWSMNEADANWILHFFAIWKLRPTYDFMYDHFDQGLGSSSKKKEWPS